jgi:hypothetical protein
VKGKNMSSIITYLPSKKADILNYAKQVHDALSATGIVAADYGLVAGDVTALGTNLDAAQTAFNDAAAARLAATAKTSALSGAGSAMDQLVNGLRDLASKIKASDATDDVLASLGISRRSPNLTPSATPVDAPEFTLESIKPNLVNVRFRENGSASPRARMASAIGVQIAIVNGTTAPVDNEADHAPNVFQSRNPASLNSAGWPTQTRLYARWITQRGQTGPWSLPLSISVL